MLTIENKALKAAKKKSSFFIVKPLCSRRSCAGNVKEISVKLAVELSNQEHYTVLEYNGINVYIHKTLQIDEHVFIYQILFLPVLGPVFNIKGVTIRNYS